LPVFIVEYEPSKITEWLCILAIVKLTPNTLAVHLYGMGYPNKKLKFM